MLDLELVKKTEEFLKEKFEGSVYLNGHPEAKAYRIEHTYRVANIGRELAAKEGFDETEMVIRVLSFGPMIRVTAPEHFVGLLRQRIERQMQFAGYLPGKDGGKDA